MHFENGFIKNDELLKENSNIDDLLNRDSEILKFSERINEIPGSTIWGIVGHFGIGKSTLINNVKNYRNNMNKNEKRFEFDARKYPDRKDLWEGFVLDFAKQVDNKTFEKARKTIDGKQNEDKEVLCKTVGDILSNIPILGGIIPGGNAVSNLSYFFKSSPARRVFEIQEIFEKLIKKIKEDKIIIVIEDIDRSGDSGVFFLETLKQFISKNNFGKEILIIMPLGTNEYYNNIESYVKPIEYFDFFAPNEINLDNFINKIFIDEIINSRNLFQPLKEFLEGLLIYYPKEINIRKLKLIIRKANQNHILMYGKYDDLFDLDWRLNIIFEAIKYIDFNDNKENLFDRCEKEGFSKNSLISSYLYNLIGHTQYKEINKYYYGDKKSIFKSKYDEFKQQEINIFNTINSIDFKFGTKISENGIIGGWFGGDFKNELKHFVVPEEYLKY